MKQKFSEKYFIYLFFLITILTVTYSFILKFNYYITIFGVK